MQSVATCQSLEKPGARGGLAARMYGSVRRDFEEPGADGARYAVDAGKRDSEKRAVKGKQALLKRFLFPLGKKPARCKERDRAHNPGGAAGAYTKTVSSAIVTP